MNLLSVFTGPDHAENPVGRRFNIGLHDRTIVGVVSDIRVRGLEMNSEPQVYLPYKQVPDRSLINYVPKALVIRTHGRDESPPYEAARRIIQRIDPEMPVADPQTLQEIVDGQTALRETQIRVIGAFAVLSLLLAGIGIHGLLAFAVSQRVPEIGLRIALGARSNDILRIVLNKGFHVAAIGAVLGMLHCLWRRSRNASFACRYQAGGSDHLPGCIRCGSYHDDFRLSRARLASFASGSCSGDAQRLNT